MQIMYIFLLKLGIYGIIVVQNRAKIGQGPYDSGKPWKTWKNTYFRSNPGKTWKGSFRGLISVRQVVFDNWYSQGSTSRGFAPVPVTRYPLHACLPSYKLCRRVSLLPRSRPKAHGIFFTFNRTQGKLR